jgi:hypothetical protein
MRRGVRSQAPEGLHALALARDRPAARLLVGRHHHVDEPLEEVALRLLTDAPCFLECLVGLEERSGARQRKAPLV